MRNPFRCRTAAVLLAVLLAGASQAQNHDKEHPFRMPGTPAKVVPAPTPWMSGAQLLQQLDPPVRTANRQATVDEATRYLMGIHDATESGLWCYTDGRPRPTPKQSPKTMRSSTLAYLRKLPAERLNEKAAVLIIRMWQEKWPCPPDGCCPGRGY